MFFTSSQVRGFIQLAVLCDRLLTRASLSTEKDFPPHDTPKHPAQYSLPSKSAGSREHDASSGAESGDSEIELVSEEPSKVGGNNPFAPPSKSKGTPSQPSNPFDIPPVAKGGSVLAGNHAPPTAYSILREEREAELDSDLFIESASEESPKREQGSSGPKQGVSVPSPLVSSSAVAPRSTSEAAPPPQQEPPIPEKAKTPVRSEEERSPKPKPPTAAVPPEVRLEKPQQDDMHRSADKGAAEAGKPTASIFPGFNKQQGQSAQVGRRREQMKMCGKRLHQFGEFHKLCLTSVAKYCRAHGNRSLVSLMSGQSLMAESLVWVYCLFIMISWLGQRTRSYVLPASTLDKHNSAEK